MAWVLGNRDTATFKRLDEKVKHLTKCMFFTDNWKAFSDVLPPERHIIGKKHTHTIERDNSNTRHHLGRMTRRTKVVSQKKEMVDLSLKLWLALTDNETFKKFQQTALNIYR